MSSVQLGFCVPVEAPDQLKFVGHRTTQWSNWDGGQVGGCPSWLTSTVEESSPPACSKCRNAMIFIAQIYAPKDDESHSYHRSIYVFACARDSQVSVWRFNIPRDNPFWPYDGDQEEESGTKNDQLCVECGFSASGVCFAQKLPFCGRTHQLLHFGRTLDKGVMDEVSRGLFTPMYELVVEEEEGRQDEDEEDGAIVANGDSDAMLEQADLNAALLGQERTSTREDDIMYEKFRDRIDAERMQVLRYGGSPLWMTAQTPSDIPPCGNCGGERSFEFQLMPQLLHYLKGSLFFRNLSDDDSPLLSPDELKQQASCRQPAASELDWGVVAIYTCKGNCASTSYVNEYAYVQTSISSTQQ